jgi:glyoxylase-like metal-dependent hydrolase (beta-lactamase superfamily II)
MFNLGPLRLDLINDGLFELKNETFVKVLGGENRTLRDRPGVNPRIRVGFNCLLIRGLGHTVLVDPGTGDKPLDSQVREYAMEYPRNFFPALESLSVDFRDVDTVILTHLHWDHAGGATSVGYSGQIEPTFPRAKYYVQKRELDAAREAILTQDDGYLADDFEPLVSAQVLEAIEADDFQVFPWLSLHWTGGHSQGHQIVVIGEPGQPRAIYFADLIPTTSQIPFDSAMSYDVKYDQLAASKKRFLNEAVQGEYLVMFVHAPRNRAGYLSKDQDDKYRFRAVDL